MRAVGPPISVTAIELMAGRCSMGIPAHDVRVTRILPVPAV
jgi:hypothetical protein